jgi:hypothetical protein
MERVGKETGGLVTRDKKLPKELEIGAMYISVHSTDAIVPEFIQRQSHTAKKKQSNSDKDNPS